MSDSIKSQSEMRTLVTDEFRDNHERIFGERKPSRGSWVWSEREQRMVPASEFVPEHSDERVPVLTDLYMDGVRAIDGTDIGSREKRREYMRRNNVTDSSDFAGTWAKAEKDRAEFYQGKKKDPAVREALGRALYAARKRQR